jgi:hypothetical protein
MVDHPASLVVDALDRVDKYQYHYRHRNVLPHNRPDMLHISMENDDQLGSFTLSIGHGNGHRVANYYLERGTITVDMTRMIISVIRGHGPAGGLKKIKSGVGTGFSIAFGAVANVYKVATGKLRKAPGIFALVENFYETIAGREPLIVREEVTTQMTEMLDTVWEDINSNPIEDAVESKT